MGGINGGQPKDSREKIQCGRKIHCDCPVLQEIEQFQHHNGNCCVLNMWVVRRLLKDWKMQPKYLAIYSFLRQIVEPTQNYSHYRAALKKCSKPCLPYLGVFLKDLNFVEDGNQEFISENIINIPKINSLGEQLRLIQSFQRADFGGGDKRLLKYVANLQYFTEDKLERLSLAENIERTGTEEREFDEGAEELGLTEEQADEMHSQECSESFEQYFFEELVGERPHTDLFTTYIKSVKIN